MDRPLKTPHTGRHKWSKGFVQCARAQQMPEDPQGRPTLLFDLNGVLIQAKRGSNPADEPEFVPGKLPPFVPRPGLVHLLSLRPFFRLGLYTSASETTARNRLVSITKALASTEVVQTYMTTNMGSMKSRQLQESFFPILLTRNHCAPDTEWQQREDGKAHDTVKPIAAHGFDLSRTVLIDDSLRKVLSGERDNNLVLPTLFRCTDPQYIPETDSTVEMAADGRYQVPLMRVLCRLLLHHLAGEQNDVRVGLQHLRQDLAQALQSRDGSTPLPACLQHLKVCPWAPAALELPLLFPSPSPLVTPCLPDPTAIEVHRALCSTSKSSPSLTSTAPLEGAAFVGHVPLTGPTLLINLELLVDTTRWSPVTCSDDVVLRRGCHHIASILSVHRLAVFCSWPSVPAKVAVEALNKVLMDHVWENKDVQRKVMGLRGMYEPPRRTDGESGDEAWQCIEFVLCKEALVHSQDGLLDITASLHAAGLKTESALVITTLPEPFNPPPTQAEQLQTVRVPLLPDKVGKTVLQCSRASTTVEQQQQLVQQASVPIDALGMNVDSVVDVDAKEYPVIRMLCWHLVVAARRAIWSGKHSAMDLGIADVQQCMDQIAAGQWQPKETTQFLLQDVGLDNFDLSFHKSANKSIRALMLQYSPLNIHSAPLVVARGSAGPPPVHENLLEASQCCANDDTQQGPFQLDAALPGCSHVKQRGVDKCIRAPNIHRASLTAARSCDAGDASESKRGMKRRMHDVDLEGEDIDSDDDVAAARRIRDGDGDGDGEERIEHDRRMNAEGGQPGQKAVSGDAGVATGGNQKKLEERMQTTRCRGRKTQTLAAPEGTGVAAGLSQSAAAASCVDVVSGAVNARGSGVIPSDGLGEEWLQGDAPAQLAAAEPSRHGQGLEIILSADNNAASIALNENDTENEGDSTGGGTPICVRCRGAGCSADAHTLDSGTDNVLTPVKPPGSACSRGSTAQETDADLVQETPEAHRVEVCAPAPKGGRLREVKRLTFANSAPQGPGSRGKVHASACAQGQGALPAGDEASGRRRSRRISSMKKAAVFPNPDTSAEHVIERKTEMPVAAKHEQQERDSIVGSGVDVAAVVEGSAGVATGAADSQSVCTIADDEHGEEFSSGERNTSVPKDHEHELKAHASASVIAPQAQSTGDAFEHAAVASAEVCASDAGAPEATPGSTQQLQGSPHPPPPQPSCSLPRLADDSARQVAATDANQTARCVEQPAESNEVPKEEPSMMQFTATNATTNTLSHSLATLRAKTASSGAANKAHVRATSLRHSFSSGVKRSLDNARRGLQCLPQKVQGMLGRGRAPPYSSTSLQTNGSGSSKTSKGAKGGISAAADVSTGGSKGNTPRSGTAAATFSQREKQLMDGPLSSASYGGERPHRSHMARTCIPETAVSREQNANNRGDLNRRQQMLLEGSEARGDSARAVAPAVVPRIETMVQPSEQLLQHSRLAPSVLTGRSGHNPANTRAFDRDPELSKYSMHAGSQRLEEGNSCMHARASSDRTFATNRFQPHLEDPIYTPAEHNQRAIGSYASTHHRADAPERQGMDAPDRRRIQPIQFPEVVKPPLPRKVSIAAAQRVSEPFAPLVSPGCVRSDCPSDVANVVPWRSDPSEVDPQAPDLMNDQLPRPLKRSRGDDACAQTSTDAVHGGNEFATSPRSNIPADDYASRKRDSQARDTRAELPAGFLSRGNSIDRKTSGGSGGSGPGSAPATSGGFLINRSNSLDRPMSRSTTALATPSQPPFERGAQTRVSVPNDSSANPKTQFRHANANRTMPSGDAETGSGSGDLMTGLQSRSVSRELPDETLFLPRKGLIGSPGEAKPSSSKLRDGEQLMGWQRAAIARSPGIKQTLSTSSFASRQLEAAGLAVRSSAPPPPPPSTSAAISASDLGRVAGTSSSAVACASGGNPPVATNSVAPDIPGIPGLSRSQTLPIPGLPAHDTFSRNVLIPVHPMQNSQNLPEASRRPSAGGNDSHASHHLQHGTVATGAPPHAVHPHTQAVHPPAQPPFQPHPSAVTLQPVWRGATARKRPADELTPQPPPFDPSSHLLQPPMMGGSGSHPPPNQQRKSTPEATSGHGTPDTSPSLPPDLPNKRRKLPSAPGELQRHPGSIMHDANALATGVRSRFADTVEKHDDAAAALEHMQPTHAAMGGSMPQIVKDLQLGLQLRPSPHVPYMPAPVDAVKHGTDASAPQAQVQAQAVSGSEVAAHAGFAGPNTINGLACDTSLSPLHFEVYEFARRASPTATHLLEVRRLLDRMNQLLQGVRDVPGCHAVMFGSFPAGLSLPDSDIDVVLLQERPPFPPPPPAEGFKPDQKRIIVDQLHSVRRAFVHGGLFNTRNSFVIGNARVPLIRVASSRIPGSSREVKVDISMGVSNGARAVSFVQRQVQAMPPLRPLVLVLKALLKLHNLNEARLGGLSSYCLLNMVMAHLQIQGYGASFSDKPEPVHFEVAEQLRYVTHLSHACTAVGVASGYSAGQPDLGHLLVSFLARYGSQELFDNRAHAVSVRQGGVVSIDAVALKQKSGQPLVVEDPQQPMHGVGASASRIGDVLQLFAAMRDRLSSAAQQWKEDSLLPVSDTALREFCLVSDHRKLPEAPETLMLGHMVSLDCALGPSDHPYHILREHFSEFFHSQRKTPTPPHQTPSTAAPVDLTGPEIQDAEHAAADGMHASTDAAGVQLLVRGQLLLHGAADGDVLDINDPAAPRPHSPSSTGNSNGTASHGAGTAEHPLDLTEPDAYNACMHGNPAPSSKAPAQAPQPPPPPPENADELHSLQLNVR